MKGASKGSALSDITECCWTGLWLCADEHFHTRVNEQAMEKLNLIGLALSFHTELDEHVV